MEIFNEARTASDKVLHDNALKIAKNQKYDGYQRGLASWFLNKFFDKKSVPSSGATLANKSALKNMSNG